MKRLLVVVLMLLFVLPALAQETAQTYTLGTGTSINYPNGWTAELTDDLVILTLSDISRAIVIDYPIVDLLTNGSELTLTNSLLALGRNALDVDITQSDIEPFDIGERMAARWSANNNGTALSLVAVTFENGGIGMLIAVGVSDVTLLEMVASFDNAEAINNTSSSTELTAPERDSLFFFNDGARFTLPQAWTGQRQGFETGSIVRLAAPDASVNVALINLLGVVAEDTPLEEVLNVSQLATADFGFEYTIVATETIRIGDHDGLRYTLDVTLNGQMVAGEIIITQYSDEGYGFILAYGPGLENYRQDLNIIIGSMNNTLYGLDLRS